MIKALRNILEYHIMARYKNCATHWQTYYCGQPSTVVSFLTHNQSNLITVCSWGGQVQVTSQSACLPQMLEIGIDFILLVWPGFVTKDLDLKILHHNTFMATGWGNKWSISLWWRWDVSSIWRVHKSWRNAWREK